jgi:hypothetical protein
MVLEFAPDSPEVSYSRHAKFRRGPRRVPVRCVVWHSAETPEHSQVAERVCDYFADNVPHKASTHYIVDNNSTAQSVPEADTCYGAGGANNDCVHIEQAGRAAQTAAQWMDPYGLAMLERLAVLTAELCHGHMIPVVQLSPAQFNAGAKGIIGHAGVVAATGIGSHWDPGPGFPWSYALQRTAHHYILRVGGTPPPTGPPQGATVTTTFGNSKFTDVYNDRDVAVLFIPIAGSTDKNYHIRNKVTGAEAAHRIGNNDSFPEVHSDVRRFGDTLDITVKTGGNVYSTVTVPIP